MGTSIQESAPEIIVVTSIVFAVLAAIGCFFVGVSYFLHARLRSFTFQMILWMAIFDGIVVCGSVTGPIGTLSNQSGVEKITWQCKAQAACVQFGIIASLIWVFCFSIHLIRITGVKAKAYEIHTISCFIFFLLLTLGCAGYSVYYIFSNHLVGVSGSDDWCWIKEDYIDDYSWKLMYLPSAIIIFIDLILYFFMRVRLNVLTSQQLESSLLKQNRRRFVRAIAGGLSAYLGAPFIAWVPAHFNWVCTKLGFESESHVISWYILSALLHGILHLGIFVCGIGLVRQSWSLCCDKSARNRRSLKETEQFYMELV